MHNEMEQFRQVFFEEAAEHVLNMESALLAMEHAPDDRDLLNTIFRGAHSIKGASGTFEFHEVAHFTHSLENVLDKMRAGEIDSSPERLDVLLRSMDVLRGLLASAMGKPEPPRGVEQVLAELNGILGQDPKPVATHAKADRPQSVSAPHEYRLVFVPDQDLLRQGMDPVLLLRDLAQAGEIVQVGLDISRLPPLVELDPENCYLSWSVHLKTEQPASQVEEVFAYVRDSAQVAIEPVAGRESLASDIHGPVDTEAVPEPPETSSRSLLATAHDLIQAAIVLVHAETCLATAAGRFVASEVFSAKGAQKA